MHTKIGEKARTRQLQLHVDASTCNCFTVYHKRAHYLRMYRVKEYIQMGLDKDIVDPDNGANTAKKLTALQMSGLDLT